MGAVGNLQAGPQDTPGPAPAADPIRLTVVQYGDYAEAVARFAAGGEANYYAQRYTVDFVAALARRPGVERITEICFAADLPASVTPAGVHCVGIALYPPAGKARFQELVAMIAASRPTHLVVAAPIRPAIRWALRQRLPVLPLFADSFHGRGLRQRLRNLLLARLLNRPGVDLVANHNLAAALDLARIGVSRDKILPFDWPEMVLPEDYPPKPAPAPDRPLRLIYVGQLNEAKGVGDAVRALAILRRQGCDARLTLVGAGDAEAFRALARAEGVEAQVTLTGLLPHRQVLAEMRGHDIVLVPSHHAYPEGLPMTLYEALCVRSPLVVSDHPMFRLRIHDGVQALVHPERDPGAMAERILRLASDPASYEAFSRRAAESVTDYLCPLKWDRLIEDFLDPAHREGLRRFSLARHAYL
ncbi:glycosyltransferase [Paracoccus sp. (in: a-proteobacteria)]|uniref:glycosyltransferase n=1 Tax=Paracoccus sp. TaxID=267 RepID=UPI00321FB9BF